MASAVGWTPLYAQERALLFRGNSHAAGLQAILERLLILGQPVESLPELTEFDIDPATEQIMKETVSSLLFSYMTCAYEE